MYVIMWLQDCNVKVFSYYEMKSKKLEDNEIDYL